MAGQRRWWNQPDQFDALTAFLNDRGLARPTRWLMVLVAGSSALTPVPILVSAGRGVTAALVVSVLGAALTLMVAWFWLTRWPTRRQSLVACLAGILWIAAWSLTQSSPAVAALACTAAAITGGYLAFFHGSKPMLFNMAVGLAISVVAAIRLAHQNDLPAAVAGFWLMCLVNLSLPLAIRGTSRAMSRYAADSDADPLTGLLNRRGFGDVLGRLLSSMPTRSGRQLAMVMVDLDDFKRVNDTYGHAEGDRTLRCVADLLRDSTPDDGLVCRAGGEEFLIALTSRSPDVAELADRLCDDVRSNLDGVTASVGVAVARLAGFPGTPDTEIVDRMINAADHAMYEAKRSGGDRVVVTTDHPLADGRFREH